VQDLARRVVGEAHVLEAHAGAVPPAAVGAGRIGHLALAFEQQVNIFSMSVSACLISR
jgi:hypothetical protein